MVIKARCRPILMNDAFPPSDTERLVEKKCFLMINHYWSKAVFNHQSLLALVQALHTNHALQEQHAASPHPGSHRPVHECRDEGAEILFRRCVHVMLVETMETQGSLPRAHRSSHRGSEDSLKPMIFVRHKHKSALAPLVFDPHAWSHRSDPKLADMSSPGTHWEPATCSPSALTLG